MAKFSDESEFVFALQNGDSSAFKKLVETYSAQIFRLCYSFLKLQAQAEDQTQEVFIQIFQTIHQFRKGSSLSTWIYKVTVRSCLDAIRAANRQKRKPEGIISISEVHDMVPALSLDPYAHLQNKEYAVVISRALDLMPEKYKTAFILKFMDDLPVREIGQIMDMSDKAIEGILARAKSVLRQELINFFPDIREKL